MASFDPSARKRAQSGSSNTPPLFFNLVGVPPSVWPHPALIVGEPITTPDYLMDIGDRRPKYVE